MSSPKKGTVVGELVPQSSSRFKTSVLTISKPKVTLGRGIGLPVHHSISSRHIDVEFSPPTHFYITDFSKNGTFVNGIRLQKGVAKKLTDGDSIGIVIASADLPRAAIFPVFTLVSKVQPPPAPPSPPPMPDDSDDVTMVDDSPTRKRKRDDSSDSSVVPSPKRRKLSGCPSNVTCSICGELYHNPVQFRPCSHTFCSSCACTWRVKDGREDCPKCGDLVLFVRKDMPVRKLVDDFCGRRPDFLRTDAEIGELEAENEYCDDYLEGEEEDERRHQLLSNDYHFIPPAMIPSGKKADVAPIRPKGICSECDRPASDGFQCPSDGSAIHEPCGDCGAQIPIRPMFDDRSRAQKCASCDVVSCSPYFTFGCLSSNHALGPDYAGGLRLLHEWIFTQFPDSLLLNPSELELLVDYMERADLEVRDVFQAICDRLEAGADEFWGDDSSAVASGFGAPKNTKFELDRPVCFNCAKGVFMVGVYFYRAEIGENEFGDSRRKCWYGRECRTQWHNSDHAARLCHIGENTRS